MPTTIEDLLQRGYRKYMMPIGRTGNAMYQKCFNPGDHPLYIEVYHYDWRNSRPEDLPQDSFCCECRVSECPDALSRTIRIDGDAPTMDLDAIERELLGTGLAWRNGWFPGSATACAEVARIMNGDDS